VGIRAEELSDSEAAWNFVPHPYRAAVLAELHARPFTPLLGPTRVMHFAFDTSGDRAVIDRRNFDEFCIERGQPAAPSNEKHHRVQLGAVALRWEQHSEFTTYSWESPSGEGDPFASDSAGLSLSMRQLPQPGPLLVAADLHLVRALGSTEIPEHLFDRASLAVAENSDGKAVFATDFKAGPTGFVRILVKDRGLEPQRAGALVQRLLELKTYRTLALLGLPEAQRLSPSVSASERRLVEATEDMRNTADPERDRLLLAELTALAADVEAGAASSLFRFGASRAYEQIVEQRLQTIGEKRVGGFSTWSSFLARRMKPALRTCAAMEARQSSLSLKLARAADLLRTRVDVELEQQNQELLKSMNARTRLQLRLQSTVEGLSVAAVTYYVVGLFSYVCKAVQESGLIRIDANLMTAAFVPVAALAIWLMVRRIRLKHAADDPAD
jgi:uncharacterized membrane-anchored protein